MVKRGDLREVLALTIISVIAVILTPLTALFVFGGAEAQANLFKFLTYGVQAFGFVMVISFVRLFRSEGFFSANKDLEPFKYFTFHSPTESLLYQELKKLGRVGEFVAEQIRSPIKFSLIWGMIGIAFGTLAGVTGTFSGGIPDYTVQGSISPVGSLALAVEPAVFTETLFVIFVYFLFRGIYAYLLINEVNMEEKFAYIVASLFAVVTDILAFMFQHILRYGNQEGNLLATGILGFIKATTLAVFRSGIPGYMIHFFGNLYEQLIKLGLFGNEVVLALSVTLFLLTGAMYIATLNLFE